METIQSNHITSNTAHIHTVETHSIQSIDAVFASQLETMYQLRQSTASERIAKIKKLKTALLAHQADVLASGFADFNKPATEVELTEILPVIAEANDTMRHLRRWMKVKKVWPSRMMFGTSAFTQYEPKGRVLIIAPWNYPITLTLGPLISALAAGNTVIIKTSEMAPHASHVMATIIREVFTPNEVALFEGEVEVAQQLLALPFDHVFFTGSPAVGKVVMTAAAKHLTSVTLELGGKSPTIVDETADLDLAAKAIAWAKFTNNGQTCIAPDHVYVHQSVKTAFIQKLAKHLTHVYGQPAQQINSPFLARIVNSRHTTRVKSLLDDAVAKGATVAFGGVVDESQRFISPTLLENVPQHATIMQDEIFGPLFPVIEFKQLDEVIDRINKQPKALALYVWSRNNANIRKVLQQTTAGGSCINHCAVQFLHGNLPFGGVNNSGIGSSHGHHGFLAFSHERAVVRNRLMIAKLFFPPYTNQTRKLIAWFTKIL